MEIDTSGWSGEGELTQRLIDSIGGLADVGFLKVEDAPASRAESGYNFISNELFVRFATRRRLEPAKWLGIIPASRPVAEKTMTLEDLVAALERIEEVGPCDYSDEGMIQYLRTERIIPPYQTRGYKLVELVRIYEVTEEPRR